MRFPEAFDELGFPIQRGGSSTIVPGLHFMGVHFQRKGVAADCEVGSQLAARCGFSSALQTAFLHSFERWDGQGAPNGTRGEDIPLSSRLATLGFAAVMWDGVGGRSTAIEAVTQWRSRILDRSLADAVLHVAAELLDVATPSNAWEAVVALEPGKSSSAGEVELEAIAKGFADVADLKSRYLVGHSSGVANLAELTGRRLGPAEQQIKTLRWAGLLHDINRAGVATGVWDEPSRLTRAEWEEEVRLHPYHAQRILSRAPALAEIARIKESYLNGNHGCERSGFFLRTLRADNHQRADSGGRRPQCECRYSQQAGSSRL